MHTFYLPFNQLSSAGKGSTHIDHAAVVEPVTPDVMGVPWTPFSKPAASHPPTPDSTRVWMHHSVNSVARERRRAGACH